MANDFSALPFEIGTTFYGSNTASVEDRSTAWEGKEFWIQDLDYSTQPYRFRTYGATGWKKIRIMRNTSGITILPGAIVQSATVIGTRFDGLSSVSYSRDQFVVDEFLNATTGVPANDLCYVTVEGVCRARVSVTPAEAVWTAGSNVYNVTAAASTTTTTAGRAFAGAVIGAATTYPGDQVVGRLGVALSACTTNETGSLKLIRKYV